MNAQDLLNLSSPHEPAVPAQEPSVMSALRSHARIFRAGDLICLEGEPSRSIIFMLKGAIGVYRNEKLIRVLRGEQMFLGYIAFFGGHKRTATLRAKSDSEILLIPEDKIEATLGIAPTLALRLTRDATSLFLAQDLELERYRKLGASAQNSMTQKKLAHFVEQAKEGATLKAKLEKIVPALVVGLTTRSSERVAFHLVRELLDSLEPHLDPKTFTLDDASLRSATDEAIVGESLVHGLRELADRQAHSEHQRAEKKRREPELIFNKSRKGLRGVHSNLKRKLEHIGESRALKPFSEALTAFETALAKQKFDVVLDEIETALNELNQLSSTYIEELKTEGLVRLYDQARTHLAQMHGAIESVHGASLSDELESGVFDRIQVQSAMAALTGPGRS